MPPELGMLLFTSLLATAGEQLPQATDLELLEFIGAFETRGGQWLDPLSLDDRDLKKPQPVREEKKYE